MSAQSLLNHTLRAHLRSWQTLHRYKPNDMASVLGCTRKAWDEFLLGSTPHFDFVYHAAEVMGMSILEALSPPKAAPFMVPTSLQGRMNGLAWLAERIQTELQELQREVVS